MRAEEGACACGWCFFLCPGRCCGRMRSRLSGCWRRCRVSGRYVRAAPSLLTCVDGCVGVWVCVLFLLSCCVCVCACLRARVPNESAGGEWERTREGGRGSARERDAHTHQRATHTPNSTRNRRCSRPRAPLKRQQQPLTCQLRPMTHPLQPLRRPLVAMCLRNGAPHQPPH